MIANLMNTLVRKTSGSLWKIVYKVIAESLSLTGIRGVADGAPYLLDVCAGIENQVLGFGTTV